MNYTINEIPNTATEANDADFAVLYQGDKTKKISFQNLFNKARRNNIFITATNTTIVGPKLQAGDVIRVFFIAQQEGTDTTTAMALSYNNTSYNVKAPCNGSLKDFTANAITVETRELSKGAETEEEEKVDTKSTRATSTAYVYCQAYTTLELLFDGTQFVIIGNPVVISNSDYTIYTDGSVNHKKIKYNTNLYTVETNNFICPVDCFVIYTGFSTDKGYNNYGLNINGKYCCANFYVNNGILNTFCGFLKQGDRISTSGNSPNIPLYSMRVFALS
jgi:hypothetical protein